MFRARCFFAFVAFCAAAFSMQGQDEMTATYIRHALEITVPYHGVHQGAGHLEVTLLSPEDKVLARSETLVKASAANGIWQAELAPDPALPFDDLVWERVRSRVLFEGEQTPAVVQIRSVSTILRHPVVHLLGQTNYLAGAPAALRVIVTDGTPTASPVTNGTVRIELAKGPETILFSGKLDRRGSTNSEFRFPTSSTVKLHSASRQKRHWGPPKPSRRFIFVTDPDRDSSRASMGRSTSQVRFVSVN